MLKKFLLLNLRLGILKDFNCLVLSCPGIPVEQASQPLGKEKPSYLMSSRSTNAITIFRHASSSYNILLVYNIRSFKQKSANNVLVGISTNKTVSKIVKSKFCF